MSVVGKHAVVTGGGTGVGAEIAHALAEAGAAVTIMGRSEDALKAQGLPYQLCDVTDAAFVAEAMARAREQHGPIEIMVANAGAATSVPFAKMPAEHLMQMLSVNLIGVSHCWQAVLPDMKAAGWGRMIAVASTAAQRGYPYVAAYCAAKHGVLGLTRAIARELARTGITVNALCPGFIETPLLERSIANIMQTTGKTEDEAADMLKANNPQGRFIETDEVAGAALWLCSDAARSVTGHALSISGGET